MKKYIKGKYVEMTPEELSAMQAAEEKAEAEYWASVDYDSAVNAEIRKRYTESQEFAILRQRSAKQNEFAEYYAFCEECKAYVKSKKGAG